MRQTMSSNTARLNKAERADLARKAREEAALDAKIKAMSDAELDELIGDIARDLEVAHGPVEPQDFSPALVGLDDAARDKFFASLPARDFVAWRKHDEIAAANGRAPDAEKARAAGNAHAETGPPPEKGPPLL